ncbi:MAG: hypothetical protein JSV07_04820 [Acidimicrobiia bacterium]|jgi:type II secretory pathway pseudopilin PulG|nr:MAG: hypothetical protein JSV07_04820 [Acidimicrobiia bacterium]
MDRFRSDDGITLVELMITVVLLTIIGVIVGGIMASSLRSTRNLEGAADSNDEVRLVIQQMERDFRSAEQVCEPTGGDTGDSMVIRVQTGSGIETIKYTLDYDKDGDSVEDADDTAHLIRTVDTGDSRVVVENVVNRFVQNATGDAQPLFTSQSSGDEPGAPSFGKVVSFRVWIDANPLDDISPKLETTELSGRNIWNPNAGC